MKLLKYLFFYAAIFCSSYCQAQQFDTIAVDKTTYPGTTYVRIRFPHNGFQYNGFIQQASNMIPPYSVISLFFKECAGTTGVSYFEDTLTTYVLPDERIYFNLYLEANTWDSSCVLRPGRERADTFYIEFNNPTAVADAKESDISVYPNPVKNRSVTIETGNFGNKLATATLYSLQGSLLGTYPLHGSKAEIVLPEHLPPGNYLLLLSANNGELTRKRITVQ